MYKCLECGNTEKFYGIAKERGNALIFQNCGEFKGCDGGSVLEEALNTLRKNHVRQKQAVGVPESYPNAVCIDTGPCQVSDPGPNTVPDQISDMDTLTEISDRKNIPGSGNDHSKASTDCADPAAVIRGNLWAIQNDDKGQEVNWAYIISDKSWKGFHEVRSCAACHSTNIANI
jgi:hypothetical protein